MFPITRIAYKTTKLGRNLVKKVATNKINIAQASDDLAVFHSEMNKIAPHSKNIFKRAYYWVKTFIVAVKDAYSSLKTWIAEEAELRGKKLNLKEKINIAKYVVKLAKERVTRFKTEMKDLATK